MKSVKITLASLVLFVLSTQSVAAFCIGIWVPPEREYSPPEHTRAMIAYVGDTQAIVLEPLFEGNAEDFGMMLPVPAEPKITEAPEKIFDELEDLTNPTRQFPMMMDAASGALGAPEIMEDDGVEVIEQQELGDFAVTTLRATRVDALTDWLERNQYQYTENDVANFEYYVDQAGYYFVALRVLVDAEVIAEDGTISGRLSPIDIRFQTKEPVVPIRTVAGNTSMRMTFTLYTLGDSPWYIPGTDIQYAQKLQSADMNEAPSLPVYGALKRWLVRHEVAFDPSLITEDIILTRGSEKLSVAPSESALTVDPAEVPSKSGVLVSDLKNVRYLGSTKPTESSVCLELNRNLALGARGGDVRQLQTYLQSEGFFNHSNLTEYFGPITQAAVQAYQRDRGIVSSGSAWTTGYGLVGPQTRARLGADCTPQKPKEVTKEIRRVQERISELEAELTTWREALEKLLQ